MTHVIDPVECDIAALASEFRKRVSVAREDECWEWSGTRTRRGYGLLSNGTGRQLRAHRVSFFLAFGELPPAVCHRCDNPPCVNPAHLFGGTQSDNLRDMYSKGRARPLVPSRGEANHLSKLTEAAVRDIRRARAAGVSVRVLAEQYGVGLTAIKHVANGKTWAHVA